MEYRGSLGRGAGVALTLFIRHDRRGSSFPADSRSGAEQRRIHGLLNQPYRLGAEFCGPADGRDQQHSVADVHPGTVASGLHGHRQCK